MVNVEFKDLALYMVIVMYTLSLMFVGFEYTFSQLAGVELTSPVTGEPMGSLVVGYLQEAELNDRSSAIVSANFTTNSTFYDRVETSITGAAFVAWELIQLLSGTYIFNVLQLLGVPIWLINTIITVYILLLARLIVGYIQKI